LQALSFLAVEEKIRHFCYKNLTPDKNIVQKCKNQMKKVKFEEIKSYIRQSLNV